MSVRKRLEQLLDRYGIVTEAVKPLEVLLESLADPAAPTSVHAVRQALDVHIADSLAGLEVAEVRSAGVLADVGAGAGLPGLVLAVALPRTRVILLEAARRKCDFLRATVASMEIGNVEVEWTRVEAWEAGLGACDVVCARAVATLPVLCEYAAPLLRVDGVLVAWKGMVDEAETTDGKAAAAHLGLASDAVRPVVPYASSQRRTLHVLRKINPTPVGYPRRPGVASKHPLIAKNLH
jgi:16S rRNA (guanine527-N7)-methyltransferase